MLEKHIDALTERFLFKGNLQPELFSYAMRSECCNAYVTLQDAFIQDGQWIICSACRDSLAFVRNEDLELMSDGETPENHGFFGIIDHSMFKNIQLVMDDFVRACQEAARKMLRFSRLFSEEDARDPLDKLIIGDGTQMVDGKWQPKGILDALSIVDGDVGAGFIEPSTQETPQSDED